MECKRHKHRVGEAQGANVPPSHLEMPAHLKYTDTGANDMSLEENKIKLPSARHIALQHRHMLAAKQSTHGPGVRARHTGKRKLKTARVGLIFSHERLILTNVFD